MMYTYVQLIANKRSNRRGGKEAPNSKLEQVFIESIKGRPKGTQPETT